MPVCDVALGYRMHEGFQPTERITRTAFESITSTFYYQVLRVTVNTSAMQQYRHWHEYWLLRIGARHTRETILRNLVL